MLLFFYAPYNMSWTLPTNEDGLVPCHSSPKHSYPQPLLPGHNQPATIYKRDILFIWRRLGNVSLCLVRSRIKRQIFWESLYSEIPKNRQIMSAYSQTCELFFGLFVFSHHIKTTTIKIHISETKSRSLSLRSRIVSVVILILYIHLALSLSP